MILESEEPEFLSLFDFWKIPTSFFKNDMSLESEDSEFLSLVVCWFGRPKIDGRCGKLRCLLAIQPTRIDTQAMEEHDAGYVHAIAGIVDHPSVRKPRTGQHDPPQERRCQEIQAALDAQGPGSCAQTNTQLTLESIHVPYI